MEVAPVFCPNCGTKNDATATACTKCGFKLSGASAPKFRGTMMLNPEQSVQDMVDEHRRKLQGAATGDPAEGPIGTPEGEQRPDVTPGVAQPPRGVIPKRRMGTMLGVAPQVGGVQPPDFGGQTPPMPVATPQPVAPSDSISSADPLGGTVAFAAPPPAVPATPAGEVANPLAAGRTEAFAIPAVEAPAPVGNVRAAGGTEPLTAGGTQAFSSVSAEPAPAPSPLAAGRTEAFAAVPEPAPAAPPPAAARGRTEAFEAPPAPLEPSAPAARAQSSPEYAAGVPRRLTPLDLFLLIITFGLYGLVLRARDRKNG